MTPNDRIQRMRQKNGLSIKPAQPAAKPVITHVCEHVSPVARFANGFCPDCLAGFRKARAEKRRERPAPVKPTGHESQRLPHNAVFRVSYDAATETWSGYLAVPGREAVQAQASGVFRLLSVLDQMYRDSLLA
jgi:hypothetical protein